MKTRRKCGKSHQVRPSGTEENEANRDVPRLLAKGSSLRSETTRSMYATYLDLIQRYQVVERVEYTTSV